MTTRIFNYPPIKYKKIAENTFVPLEGYEKGVVHYLFTRESIREMFEGFKILNVHMNKPRLHYSVLARK